MMQLANMEHLPAKIPVRSRRQAMDWSLVLVSQGIETTIEQDPETGAWELRVPVHESERAFKTLRQYHVENRGWPWRQHLPRSHTVFDWRSLAWAGLLILFHWEGLVSPEFHARGVMATNAVLAGEWWRIFTAMALHIDALHLIGNLSIGILLIGLVMGRYGSGTGLLAAYLAGALGNVASLLLNTRPFHGLGASGMVMGALGLLSVQTLRWGEYAGRSWKLRLTGVAAGLMLFVLYGLAPNSDLVAHLGGFVAGLVLGAALVFAPDRWQHNPKMNLAAGLFLIAMVLATWGLALGHR